MSMNIGLLVNLSAGTDVRKKFDDLLAMGFSRCQLVSWDEKVINDLELAKNIRALAKEKGITISVFWCGYPGEVVWNFLLGPSTIGLVPPSNRERRLACLKNGAYFAKELGVKYLATHVGFLPPNPLDGDYVGAVAAIKELLEVTKPLGITFLFETGQETPVTLLRCIQDLGGEGVGINLDSANLILYGNGNPVDALDVFGKYVYELHGKDGLYPTNGDSLGEEVPLGKGKVNYPVLLKKLKTFGFDGDITIEREIEEEEKQKEDILMAKSYLEGIIASL